MLLHVWIYEPYKIRHFTTVQLLVAIIFGGKAGALRKMITEVLMSVYTGDFDTLYYVHCSLRVAVPTHRRKKQEEGTSTKTWHLMCSVTSELLHENI